MSRLGHAFVGMAGLLVASPAWSMGTFVTPQGSDARLVASRNIVIRSADHVQIISQVKYDGAPSDLVWLIPIPNFNDPPNQGVAVGSFTQAGFDELEAATQPVFNGACDGNPTGETQSYTFQGDFGPAPNMALPTRGFIVPEIQHGDLANYLTNTLHLELTDAEQQAITGMVDQNFMFYAVRISADMLGVDRVDPIVSVTYPLAAGQQVKLPLLPMASALPDGGRANFLVWVADQQRVQSNLTTRDVDTTQVQFVSPDGTNYPAVFEETLNAGGRQTQVFVTESAGPIGALQAADLSQAVTGSGATYLTRLRTSMLAPALRANVTASLKPAQAQDPLDRTHTVDGSQCGAMPDAGAAMPDAGAAMPDAGAATPDAAASTPDAGAEADGGGKSGGGGGGGCTAVDGSGPGALALLLLLGLTRTVRRRRT